MEFAEDTFMGDVLRRCPNVTALALVRSKDEEACARWLPGLATGDLIAGCALAESTES